MSHPYTSWKWFSGKFTILELYTSVYSRIVPLVLLGRYKATIHVLDILEHQYCDPAFPRERCGKMNKTGFWAGVTGKVILEKGDF